jgi:hypothetical protein
MALAKKKEEKSDDRICARVKTVQASEVLQLSREIEKLLVLQYSTHQQQTKSCLLRQSALKREWESSC